MASIYFFVGVFLQIVFINLLFGTDLSAQKPKSIEDVYITLQLNQASLEQAFRKIEAKTDFRFAYDYVDLDPGVRINLSVNRTSVKDVLRNISRESALRFKQLNFDIDVQKIDKSASNKDKNDIEVEIVDIPITGKVTSEEDGEGLPGVNVVVKGENRGTVTDLDGNYRIEVPSTESVLIFSSVGFTSKEVTVGGQTAVNVTLSPDITALGEIIVVGYGTQQKVNVTGAVSQVTSDVLEDRPVSSVSQALQGRIPGVTVQQTSGAPGSNADIKVRGFSSLNSGGALTIIDGVPGNMNNIHPNDIESISVLKDAASAAIYGARAAEGVILITTKKGKANAPLSVQYRTFFSLKKPTRFPEMNSAVKNAQLGNLAFTNAGSSPLYPQQFIDAYSDPTITAIPRADGSDWDYVADFDWADYFLDQSFQQSHNVSLSGGGEKSTYLISGTWLDENGYFSEYGPDNFDRYTFRVNLTNELIPDKLKLETWLSLVNAKQMAPSREYDYIMQTIFQAGPNMPLYNPDGTYARYRQQQNTLQMIEQAGFDETKTNRFEGRMALTWNVTEDLSLKALGGYNVNWTDGLLWGRAYEKFSPAGVRNIGWVNQPNRVVKRAGYNRYYTTQIQADYVKSFGNHNLHVLVGGSVEENYDESTETTRFNILGNEVPALNLGDAEGATNDWSAGDWALVSGFARINYDFMGRYLLEANVRADGSSRFPAKNRWGIFPSVSAGWRISDEVFMQDQNIFSNLKLRASYGQLGNQSGLGLYDHVAVYRVADQLIPFPNGVEQQVFNPQLPSQERTWETISTTNIGLEMGFLEDKLLVEADYFIKHNEDMLVGIELPSVIGIGVPTGNYGELETKGWEALVEWRDEIKSIGLKYNVRFNMHDYKDKITDLEQEFAEPSLGFQNIQGYPINSIFAYEADGYFQTEEEVDNWAFQNANTSPGDIKYIDQDGDDVISAPNDVIFAGTTNPRYSYGINLGASWNGFDLSLFFQGVAKRSFYLDQNILAAFRNPWDNSSFEAQNDYWTPENPDARFPRPLLQGNQNWVNSTHWLQDASYIRLKNFQFGYNLPSSLLQKIRFEAVRVYFSGEDLWERTGLILFDPEISSTNARVYPLNRSYSLGLNITF